MATQPYTQFVNGLAVTGPPFVPTAYVPVTIGSITYKVPASQLAASLSGISGINVNAPLLASASGTIVTLSLSMDGAVFVNNAGVLSIIASGIPNAKLTNSSFTLGGSSISLGGTLTAPAARSTALNIDQITTHGDSIYTILNTDRVVATSATLTAPRTWTLPAASTLNAGQRLSIVDLFGGVSSTNTLTITRASSDTINGYTSFVIKNSFAALELICDGVSKWSRVAAPGNISRTVLTSGSGTYTTPNGVSWIEVEMVGAGGGGGGSGTSGQTAGSSGSATTFGSLTANPGNGGNTSGNTVSVAGGTASGGDINIQGASGGPGSYYGASAVNENGGDGGSSFFGGAGAGGSRDQGTGTAATTNSGSGGGGAVGQAAFSAGGGGAAGGYCRKIITNPAATYSYVVGTLGSAGSGGTSGSGGSSGGSGLIIVTEYY